MRDFFHDLAAALLAGLLVSAGLFAVLFAGGFLLRSFQPRAGLIYARRKPPAKSTAKSPAETSSPARSAAARSWKKSLIASPCRREPQTAPPS